MSKIYFVQEYEKGLLEDKADCVLGENRLFEKM